MRTDQGSNFIQASTSLARQAGIEENLFWEPICEGGNNRAFRLYTDRNSYFLKHYFRHPEDNHDRLVVDFYFTAYAYDNGAKKVARPIVLDHKNSIALYEFIHGRKLKAAEISKNTVHQALNFFKSLNYPSSDKHISRLSAASDACFCVQDHLSGIQNRIDRLRRVEAKTTVDNHAKQFFETRILYTWESASHLVNEQIEESDFSAVETISPKERCLSPSDFGFHNAMIRDDGSLVFFDFEYAGWDDPVKMICDFFCQPELPVPEKFWNIFLHDPYFKSNQRLQKLVKLFLPIYRLKWCCIILNDFLPTASKRRLFSSQSGNTNRKQQQLKKAEHYFSKHFITPKD